MSNPAAQVEPEYSKPPSGRFRTWLLLLVLVNLVARLPLLWEPAAVRNDGAEYLAIARSLRETGRYATDLKYQFWTDDPVHHVAWADRPPLYPYLAALTQQAMPFLDPTAAARLGNAVLACLAPVLGALWLRRLYGETAALFAAGYVFLLPHTLYWTAQPMTESVSLALSLGALLLWSRLGWGGGRAGIPWPAVGAGVLAGLTYLARPTGSLLLIVFLLDAARRAWKQEGAAACLLPAVGCLAGFVFCALPYHLLLSRVYGSPFYSSIGYTFSIGTYYEVTYHGFEREMPRTLEFLRHRWTELPPLFLRQWQAHASALALPLLGLWPFALLWRRGEWSGERWAGGALVVLSILVHALVWSAWGSSRYFLLPLLILAAALTAAAIRGGSEGASPSPDAVHHSPLTTHHSPLTIRRALALALPAASVIGLTVALVGFYRTELRPDAGQEMLPAWKLAAEEVRGSRLVASDRPQTLNLLAEVPAVMLPRTTDREKLGRFVAKYRPDVMVLFIQEPLRDEAEAQAAAWRRGELPPGWRVTQDTGKVLIARP